MTGSGRNRSSTEKGRAGEEAAAGYLQEQGYQILARNVRSPRGEVDIVCVRGNVLAFVEVKAWATVARSELTHAIGPGKRRRISHAARVFLAQHRDLDDLAPRFDVILIAGGGTIDHLEGAFEPEWHA